MAREGIKEVKRRTRRSTSFTKIGWDHLTKVFHAKTKQPYHRGQVKNKYDSLRKDWQTWQRLNKETGVGWDNVNNIVRVDDEWWGKKIVEVPLYEKFIFRGLQFQDELTSPFGSVTTTDSANWAPSSLVMLTLLADASTFLFTADLHVRRTLC